MTIELKELVAHCEQLLQPGKFRDYCPNGLQVEGKPEIKRLVSGVTASQALLDAAVAWQADAILVHHGYFWKGEAEPLTGIKGKRIRTLIQNDISLLAYHLPLDAHPELGNNAQLAQQLGLTVTGGLDVGNPDSIGFIGTLDEEMSAQAFAQRVAERLGREPLLIEGGEHCIKTIGWCTGGAQGYIDKAVELGVDAYLSGEVSEPTFHAAKENDIHYLAAGHHATERYGAKALGEALETAFDIEHRFIDIDNPV